MAAAAEALTTNYEYDLAQEEYAHSLSTIRRLGSVAVDASASGEQRAALEDLALVDFTTAITEMLKTDEEFRQLLDIENTSSHRVDGGKVRAADGTPMVTILGAGHKSSEQVARFRPELGAQAVRDKLDVENARRVDELKPGMARLMVSMDPKEELKHHKQTYRGLGYREGLAYIQYYCRVDEETLIAGSYSVDMSDLDKWREVFADLGVAVPEDESPNTWIRHALELEATKEEAVALAKSMRDSYYRKVGAAEGRSSISDYVKNNKPLVKQFFDSYYPALAGALHSGQNNEQLQAFALALLQADTSYLKPEVRSGLMRIGNLRSFDDEGGKLLDSVLRYAVVEDLRKGLKRKEQPAQEPAAAGLSAPIIFQPPVHYQMNTAEMHHRLAGNVETGARARRSYGGCAGQIDLSGSSKVNDFEAVNNPQEAYGGEAAASDAQEDAESAACEYKGKFCYCCPYKSDGSPASSLVEVTIKRGSDGVAECQRGGCGAKLDSEGKIMDEGGIYKKAQRRAKETITAA